jgi:hypothetical protein
MLGCFPLPCAPQYCSTCSPSPLDSLGCWMTRADTDRFQKCSADEISRHSLGRLPRGQSFDQAIRQGAQSIQCGVSFSCAKPQLFSDIFSALVVAAVWKNAAGFLQGNFHLGDRSIIDPVHEPSNIWYMRSGKLQRVTGCACRSCSATTNVSGRGARPRTPSCLLG